ncbi:hypothetical protein ACEPPN_010017 [Leptodophora sp. 'Broadleaf-Isolate-01']
MTGDVFEPGIEVSIILPKKGQLDVPHGQDSNNELAEKRRTISDTTKDPFIPINIVISVLQPKDLKSIVIKREWGLFQHLEGPKSAS